jgi:hypothetical protein
MDFHTLSRQTDTNTSITFAAFVLVALGCARPSTDEPTVTRAQGSALASNSAATAPRLEPRSVQRLELSAYTATLAADDEAVYVLASHAAYRFADGQPAAHWQIELGDTPALAGRSFVYWLDGKLRRAPKQGGAVEILANVPQAPRRLSASGEQLAWVEPRPDHSLLRTLHGSEPRTIYRSAGELEALALVDDQAFFVERAHERWRLGTVALGGGAARFTEAHPTRTPASLAIAGDVFYYDGPSRTVRRVPFDLSREEVVARDVICSPLTVADRIYCSQISLLFELPRDGGQPRPLVPKRPGTIAALVATKTRVAWLLDVGDSRAELEVLSR